MIRTCPLTGADLTKIDVVKLQTRLKATPSVSVRTLENALRNKYGVEPKSQGVLALSKEYAEIAVAQAANDSALLLSPRPSNKRASPSSSKGAVSSSQAGGSSKRPRRAPSVSSDAAPSSDAETPRLDSSYANSSFEDSPISPPPPLRGTPVRNHAAAIRSQNAGSTPQSRSSVNVNVGSTGILRVQSTGSKPYNTGHSSPSSNYNDSPFAGASQLPSSPAQPSRLNFDAKDSRAVPAHSQALSKTVSLWEILIVVAGAVAAIGMTAFVDRGLGLQPYQAPAAPQIDNVPSAVRSLGPQVLRLVLSKLNMTDVTEREIQTVLSFHARKGTLTEHAPDGIFTTFSRYSMSNPCGVTFMCRFYRFLWLALPLMAALVDILMRFKLLNNSRQFAIGILEELKHAAEKGRSLAASRLREELVERLGVTGTTSGINSAWRRAEAMAFRDKRLHKYAQVDGGEQTEMWQFKAGTVRSGSPGKPRSTSIGKIYDGFSLAPRTAVYALLVSGFYAIFVQ